MVEQNAFKLLDSIRQKSVELNNESVDYSSQSTSIKNIAYIVNGLHFFCDAVDIKEVSTCENLTVIPQTKRWMRGIINSKGVLYSVTDLSLFAGFDRKIQENRGHLLLLSNADKQSALLVNRVVGFRYFDEQHKLEELEVNEELPEGLSSFVNEAYQVEGETWYRLDIENLLASAQFGEVQ